MWINLILDQNHLEVLINQIAELQLPSSGFMKPGMEYKFCISNMFLNDADTAGPAITFLEALLFIIGHQGQQIQTSEILFSLTRMAKMKKTDSSKCW